MNSEAQFVDFQATAGSRSRDLSDVASLVRSARKGDQPTLGRLYAWFAPMVHGILLARVPLGEVDDLVQDVFLQALRRLHTLRDPKRFGAWLAAIARNRANDYHRRWKPITTDLEREGIDRQTQRGDLQEQADAILTIMRSLSEAYRETLILRLVEGMTGPEIAARTGLTEGSVRVNLHRGMQQLRAKLAGLNSISSSKREAP